MDQPAVTYIPDLLVATEYGEQPTPALVRGALRDALFVVTWANANRMFEVTHRPTGRTMPGYYADSNAALLVADQLTELLGDIDFWRDYARPAAYDERRRWVAENPDLVGQMNDIMRHAGRVGAANRAAPEDGT